MGNTFNSEDLIQICVGAFALAVPISFSEEAWKLSETLPALNLSLLFLISIGFLSVYTYQSVFQNNVESRVSLFVLRIVLAYIITFLVVALVLFCINKLPLLSETWVAVKRIIVITMPASMGAIVVDSFDKE
ncbi:DUF2391 family protein [Parashewanella curva]|uniref:DUF2391 family protein n=1 Tax=Parashewanella curva TaxID=2338552 RepID=A0A3L8PUB8_9GAMM|nr:DUF2391 family protein [Parashewanella curva]RLV58008.1 DUF2391 family protein [Parashewanella curva]